MDNTAKQLKDRSPESAEKCVVIAQSQGDESDKELVDKVLRGEVEEFEKLITRYNPVIYGYFYRRTVWDDLEDLVQETWIEAFENLRQLRNRHKLRAWLLSIAHNLLVNYYRRKSLNQNRETSPPEQNEGQDAIEFGDEQSATPVEQARESQLHEHVAGILEGLDEKYRMILYLRLFEEMKTIEIAEYLGIGHGAVRMRLNRGLKMLRKKIHSRKEW